MHRCLVHTEQLLNGALTFNKEESRHLKTVLRVKPGTQIELFDGKGKTRPASITLAEKNSISMQACGETVLHPAPTCAITLFVCISKGKRMDWTVEKATEIGVSQIVPVISDRTIVRLSPKECESKVERWKRVAEDAARQCGTAWIPEIYTPLSFIEALTILQKNNPVFTAALTEEAVPLRDAIREYSNTPPSAGWFVGPEGDFTPEELTQLHEHKTHFVSLGTNVLRAETASLYGLCVLSCAWM
ncbi:MAG: RsmE family RNA methyltransferase [Kiritimatiellae bacterium]|jgi:16S rRNA (uracil1498-N3)-methyltransferase|nr:RsmE family RNA methyltransferase [Kiritimatiellia bacterium]